MFWLLLQGRTKFWFSNFWGGDKILKGLRDYDGPITSEGYDMFEVLSALQKEIRRGKEYEAVFWARELESINPTALWCRLRVIASEDIGLADPLVSLIVDVLEKQYCYAVDHKNDSSRLFLVHAVLYLARAPKSRIVDNLLTVIYNDETKPEIPDYALDMHTYRGKKVGRGIDHFFNEGAKLNNQAFEDPYEKQAYEVLKKKNT
jgi:replication-associated recombination protein RarA